ncbi:hypothetical protein FSP39_000327 [Pinctada imbricata]|uniref:Uncharacterized protein n=1 Tax=Pinctada imbricata TaxID=66713 RepID=A0AA88YGC8_PINIB|nr:hypothetical protein FSP39_000327 [Pinctada imbricata]
MTDKVIPKCRYDSYEACFAGFEKKPSTDDIPPILERYLSRVADTGETLFPWQRIKPLFLNKLDQVTTKFPVEHISPSPNVENVQTDVLKSRIVKALEEFTGAPFTIQRLSEMLVDPYRHYRRIDKYLRGVEKNVQVISTVDPFGKKIISEARALVNGLDSPSNGNDALPASQPKLPVYTTFPTPQQTNWPTDSWAGVQPSSDNNVKNNTQENQSSQDNADEPVRKCPKILESLISESEESLPSEKEEKLSPSATQDHNSDSDSDLSSQESIDSDAERPSEESHSGTVQSNSNSGSQDFHGGIESATVSSSDEKVEKEVQNEDKKAELSSSSDSASSESPNSSVVVSSTEKEKDQETNPTPDTASVTEAAEQKGSDVLDSCVTSQSTEQDVDLSSTTEKCEDSSESVKTDTVVVTESDSVDNDNNVKDEPVSGSDAKSDDTSSENTSSGDVEMTKNCESTVTTTDEIRTAPQDNVNNSSTEAEPSEAPVSVPKEEEMHVDSDSSSSVVASNSCDNSQSEVKSSDVTSSEGAETPMEED